MVLVHQESDSVRFQHVSDLVDSNLKVMFQLSQAPIQEHVFKVKMYQQKRVRAIQHLAGIDLLFLSIRPWCEL